MTYFCNVYETHYLGWLVSSAFDFRSLADRVATDIYREFGWRRVFVLRVREKRA